MRNRNRSLAKRSSMKERGRYSGESGSEGAKRRGELWGPGRRADGGPEGVSMLKEGTERGRSQRSYGCQK